MVKVCSDCGEEVGRWVSSRFFTCDNCGKYFCENCTKETGDGDYCKECFDNR